MSDANRALKRDEVLGFIFQSNLVERDFVAEFLVQRKFGRAGDVFFKGKQTGVGSVFGKG
ncbi:MAG: hypothetical protein UV29_C0001G0007 [Candidatus Collierbacteria bacterium GW2011_GWD2_42_50]|nr:MAG: hypothetical protein UV29_C0001G0007 [Candidatus Collierbacteria bacterium GW2011_GWD2_42_50]KKS64525.1 MAG: hypothetical protein UV32_C0012G0009 [Candidatus Collierbacteria bacterium GW2011_GWF2_42_51]